MTAIFFNHPLVVIYRPYSFRETTSFAVAAPVSPSRLAFVRDLRGRTGAVSLTGFAEDFLQCHLSWGREKALASALFTALLGTSMGATWPRPLGDLFLEAQGTSPNSTVLPAVLGAHPTSFLLVSMRNFMGVTLSVLECASFEAT